MEDIQIISTLVGELGFPIAITIALFYQNIKNHEVIKEMSKGVDNLTVLVNELRREWNK